jgi:hypothetical protein
LRALVCSEFLNDRFKIDVVFVGHGKLLLEIRQAKLGGPSTMRSDRLRQVWNQLFVAEFVF